MCLRGCGHTELQKSKFAAKVNLGRGVTQDTPQGSVPATQVGVEGIYMQNSEYLTRIINNYIKHSGLSHCLHFHVFIASKSVVFSPKVFTQVTLPVSHWEVVSVSNRQPKRSSKYLQLLQEELPALRDFRIDFHQAVRTCTPDMSPVVVTEPSAFALSNI